MTNSWQVVDVRIWQWQPKLLMTDTRTISVCNNNPFVKINNTNNKNNNNIVICKSNNHKHFATGVRWHRPSISTMTTITITKKYQEQKLTFCQPSQRGKMVTSLCVSQDLRQGEKNRELSRQVLIMVIRIMMAIMRMIITIIMIITKVLIITKMYRSIKKIVLEQFQQLWLNMLLM